MFFQAVYLLCQKDSTDTKDTTNLFIAAGKFPALVLCCLFALLSLSALLLLSSFYPAIIWLFGADLLAKLANLANIWAGPNPSLRSNLSLFEHSLPYIFSIVVL
jgi:hypothetical protein